MNNFSWDGLQQAVEKDRVERITKNRNLALWKRACRREHDKICKCLDFTSHFFPTQKSEVPEGQKAPLQAEPVVEPKRKKVCMALGEGQHGGVNQDEALDTLLANIEAEEEDSVNVEDLVRGMGLGGRSLYGTPPMPDYFDGGGYTVPRYPRNRLTLAQCSTGSLSSVQGGQSRSTGHPFFNMTCSSGRPSMFN